MTKRVLFYIIGLTTVMSMQSCVSNYVAASPKAQTETYKTNAKLASIEKKNLDEAKNRLVASFATIDVNKVKKDSYTDVLKKEELAKENRFNQTITGILDEAMTYLGTPYRFGGMTRKGIDCSAFVLSVFGAAVGMQLPRVAASQAQEGERVERDHLQKGDLIFFAHSSRISHVGIVSNVDADGKVEFIHSASSKGVAYTTLDDSPYWTARYRFAKRVINKENFENYAHLAN